MLGCDPLAVRRERRLRIIESSLDDRAIHRDDPERAGALSGSKLDENGG